MANLHFLNQPNIPWDQLFGAGDQDPSHIFGRAPSYAVWGEENRSDNDDKEQQAGPSQSGKGAQDPSARNTGASGAKENAQGASNNKEGRGACRGRGGRAQRHPCHGGRHNARGHPWWTGSNATPSEATGNPPWKEFLQNFDRQVGSNFSDILEAGGGQPSESHVNFVPRADVFDTATQFIVHASLPGAQKSDISIEYDTEKSALFLAGVVYRPGVSEELSNALVVKEREREVGVFDRKLRLGTAADRVHVDVDNITAKLEDGVLVVTLPKLPETGANRKRIPVHQVKKDVDVGSKGKEKENEKEEEASAMQMDSETEAESAAPPYEDHSSGSHSPHVRDADAEEREYITVDVE